MDRTDPRYKRAVRIVRNDPRSRYCFVSGRFIQEGTGDPHHVLPVSLFPELAYEPMNIVIVGRVPHEILTVGDPKQVAKLPGINNLLARMASLNMKYYQTYKQKLEPWMGSQGGWD